mmetsp:Transcript_32286/g.97285  ORF Transcript_32286/g.97285 Transcript_32286/m.97285 type:complete len:404 (+) Transcript_32286:612-1823(+)
MCGHRVHRFRSASATSVRRLSRVSRSFGLGTFSRVPVWLRCRCDGPGPRCSLCAARVRSLRAWARAVCSSLERPACSAITASRKAPATPPTAAGSDAAAARALRSRDSAASMAVRATERRRRSYCEWCSSVSVSVSCSAAAPAAPLATAGPSVAAPFLLDLFFFSFFSLFLDGFSLAGFSLAGAFSLLRRRSVLLLVEASAAGRSGGPASSPKNLPTPAAAAGSAFSRAWCFFTLRRIRSITSPPALESSLAAADTTIPVSAVLPTLITISPRASPARSASPSFSSENTKISGRFGSPPGPPPPHTFIPIDDPFALVTVISIALRFARWGFGGSLSTKPSESLRLAPSCATGLVPVRFILDELVWSASSHDFASLSLIANLTPGAMASISPAAPPLNLHRSIG